MNYNIKMSQYLVLVIFITFAFAACDGGGDSKSVDPDTPDTQECNPVGDTVENPVFIENGTGEIRGTVVSSTGTPLNGVHVRAVNIADTNLQISTISGIDRNLVISDGAFTIQNVPPGSYRVLIEKLDGRNSVFNINTTGYSDFISAESTTLNFPDEYYNGADESDSDVTTDFELVAVTNGVITDDIDFITND